MRKEQTWSTDSLSFEPIGRASWNLVPARRKARASSGAVAETDFSIKLMAVFAGCAGNKLPYHQLTWKCIDSCGKTTDSGFLHFQVSWWEGMGPSDFGSSFLFGLWKPLKKAQNPLTTFCRFDSGFVKNPSLSVKRFKQFPIHGYCHLPKLVFIVLLVGQKTNLGIKTKPPGDRRLWSLLPFYQLNPFWGTLCLNRMSFGRGHAHRPPKTSLRSSSQAPTISGL